MPTSVLCNSYKQEILSGIHASNDTYKIALIKASPSRTYDASTTSVGTPGTGTPTAANLGTDEVAASGTYVAGGGSLSGFTTSLSGTTALLDFASPVSFTGATISASGAIIYNATKSNRAVAVVNFGTAITSTAGTFSVTLPASGAATSLIRLG